MMIKRSCEKVTADEEIKELRGQYVEWTLFSLFFISEV